MSLTATEIKAMKVAQLSKALEERGLPTKGLKADLAKRLLEAVEAEGAKGGAAAMDAEPTGGDDNGVEAAEAPKEDEPAAAAAAATEAEAEKEEEEAAEEKPKAAEEAAEEAEAKAEEGEELVSVKVSGLKKPVTEENVKELVTAYGEVRRFWAHPKLTHAYVTYNTAVEAKVAVGALGGLKWMNDSDLAARLVSEDEVTRAGKRRERDPKHAAGVARATALREKVTAESVAQDAAAAQESFRLTTAEPRVFWRPWTDEEAADREQRAANGEDVAGAVKASLDLIKAAGDNQAAYFAEREQKQNAGERASGSKRGRDDHQQQQQQQQPQFDQQQGAGGRRRKRRRRVNRNRADRERW